MVSLQACCSSLSSVGTTPLQRSVSSCTKGGSAWSLGGQDTTGGLVSMKLYLLVHPVQVQRLQNDAQLESRQRMRGATYHAEPSLSSSKHALRRPHFVGNRLGLCTCTRLWLDGIGIMRLHFAGCYTCTKPLQANNWDLLLSTHRIFGTFFGTLRIIANQVCHMTPLVCCNGLQTPAA